MNIRKQFGNNDVSFGKVILVGAGPGDVELLTIKALKTIESAKVIIFDNLVSEEIRQLFPSHAKKIYVGKAKGHHSATQDEINNLLVSYAQNGEDVCRVKGGDAFVFGRGSEEMLFLAQRGIQVEVVPGVTAASGCTSYAHIPLTHRGIAQGCTFITAHADKELDLNWSVLAKLNQTLVIYMGLSKTELITQELIRGGMADTMPVALIENGCTPQQRVFTGDITQLSALKRKHKVQSPALIVVGEVVSIASKMQWLTGLSSQAEFLKTEQLDLCIPA
tara:strand:+ start:1371 stop:2201 length:831 start_codon:yes stop_codon:yes gene_type:complete